MRWCWRSCSPAPSSISFALTSTITVLLPQVGQTDYVAANAFLDAFAAVRARAGQAAVAINWDAWRETGMAISTEVPEEWRAKRQESLAQGLSSREGVEAFRRIAGSGLPQVVVSTLDLVTRRAENDQLVPLATLESALPAAASHPRPALATAFVPAQTDLERDIAAVWQDILGVEPVGVHDNFFELGGNSLAGLRLVQRLRERLGAGLSEVSLYEAPTVGALARNDLSSTGRGRGSGGQRGAGEPSTRAAPDGAAPGEKGGWRMNRPPQSRRLAARRDDVRSVPGTDPKPARRRTFLLAGAFALALPLAVLAQAPAPPAVEPGVAPPSSEPGLTPPSAPPSSSPPPISQSPMEPPPPVPEPPPAPGKEPPAMASPDGKYVVRPVFFSRPPVIDGHLSDPIWKTGARIGNFTQIEPKEGEQATEQTEVYLGYDGDNLYIGARCHDSQPKKIVTTTLTRDSDMNYDDTLQILLDTYHTGRGGYVFATNSGGVQVDGLVRNEGEEIDLDWDGIWSVDSRRDAEGWTTEIVIPWRTLRFPNQAEKVFGFNVEREVAHKQERSFWKPIGHSWYARYKLSEAGTMVGLQGAKPGGRFHVAPYLIGGVQKPQTNGGTSSITQAGGDIKINLASDLVADVTIKTDFSETEADEQDVNLTTSTSPATPCSSRRSAPSSSKGRAPSTSASGRIPSTPRRPSSSSAGRSASPPTAGRRSPSSAASSSPATRATTTSASSACRRRRCTSRTATAASSTSRPPPGAPCA